MKCFTLRARRDILPGQIFSPLQRQGLSHIVPELYPQSRPGFLLLPGQNELELAPGMKVLVSPALYAKLRSLETDSDYLLIERASLERSASSALMLVPERPGDERDALVFLDIGRGDQASVRYEVGNRVHFRARRNSDFAFGSEEIALVELPPGRPFYAYRSSRRWYCFGAEGCGEQLQIRFDGENLSCQPCR